MIVTTNQSSLSFICSTKRRRRRRRRRRFTATSSCSITIVTERRTLTCGNSNTASFQSAIAAWCFNILLVATLLLIDSNNNRSFQSLPLLHRIGPTLPVVSARMTNTRYRRDQSNDNEWDNNSYNSEDEPKNYYESPSSQRNDKHKQPRNRRSRHRENSQFFHHSNNDQRQQHHHRQQNQRPLNPFEVVRIFPIFTCST